MKNLTYQYSFFTFTYQPKFYFRTPQMEQFFAALLIFLTSTAKFSMVSFAVIASGLGVGSALTNLAGGIIGIIVFTYLGTKLSAWMVKTWPEKFGRKFTKRNRRLVRIKKNFGLGGIAFLTPILLSIPVGILFSLSISNNRRKILWSMIASCVFWGLVLFVPYFAFGFNVKSIVAVAF